MSGPEQTLAATRVAGAVVALALLIVTGGWYGHDRGPAWFFVVVAVVVAALVAIQIRAHRAGGR